MVSVNCSKGSKSVSYYGEESYQDAVDDMDDIDLFTANIYPSYLPLD